MQTQCRAAPIPLTLGTARPRTIIRRDSHLLPADAHKYPLRRGSRGNRGWPAHWRRGWSAHWRPRERNPYPADKRYSTARQLSTPVFLGGLASPPAPPGPQSLPHRQEIQHGPTTFDPSIPNTTIRGTIEFRIKQPGPNPNTTSPPLADSPSSRQSYSQRPLQYDLDKAQISSP